jgi:glycosyltransferase involved in cell wall biosynthesis
MTANTPIRVNYIRGIRGAKALGVERFQDMLLATIRRDYPVQYRLVDIHWPSPKLHVPVLYTLFPAKVWLSKRPQTIYHIAHHNQAHLLNWKWLKLSPCVVSCLDLIELTQLETGERTFSPYRARHIRAAAAALQQANWVTALSEYTQKIILEHFPSLADRISIVYGGVDLQRYRPITPRPEVLNRYGIQPGQSYVLYLGSEQARKNIHCLVAAFAQIHQDFPGLKLIKAGPSQNPAGRSALITQIEHLGIQNQCQIIDYVAEDDLPDLYAGAAVFAFPSLYEGFGLPPLEAMACGTPVICSNASSLPEVMGEAGMLVNPTDIDGWAAALRRVASEPTLAQKLSEKGIAQARKFSYEAAAASMYTVYEHAALQLKAQTRRIKVT